MTPRRMLAGACAAAAAIAVPAAAERVVDYAIPEATAAAHAVEQGVALAPLPPRGPAQLAITVDPAVDHDVTRAGIACSAWAVRNPMGSLVRQYLTAWDRDGTVAAAPGANADMTVHVERASTLSRCLSTGEMKSTCITRVTIAGTIVRGGAAPRPFRVDHEAATKGVGICAGLTRGIGLVSRAAASAMIAELGKAAG